MPIYPRILLVGEHDKGFGEPFAPSTVSGKRLRKILTTLPINWSLTNMMTPSSKEPNRRDISRLKRLAKHNDKVVLLGHKVQSLVLPILPQGIKLPHPASRRKIDLITLHEGLVQLSKP